MDANYEKFERAKKRVKSIRGFYGHLIFFFIFMVLLYVVRFAILPRTDLMLEDEGFINWLDWNTYLLPILWGIAIVIHGISVYRFKFMKRWEEKKINEFLEREEQESKQNWQ